MDGSGTKMTPLEQEEYLRQMMLQRAIAQQQQQKEPIFVEDNQLRQEIYETYRRGPKLMEAHMIKMGRPLPILHLRQSNVAPFKAKPIRAPLAGHVVTANFVHRRRPRYVTVDEFEEVPF